MEMRPFLSRAVFAVRAADPSVSAARRRRRRGVVVVLLLAPFSAGSGPARLQGHTAAIFDILFLAALKQRAIFFLAAAATATGTIRNGMYPDSRTILGSYYKHASLPANRLIIAKEAAAEVKRIQQIKLPRNHNNNNALIVVDEKHGLYPFHLAARSDVNLDVLLYCIWKLYSERLARQQQQQE
jgi:hypothetical protein